MELQSFADFSLSGKIVYPSHTLYVFNLHVGHTVTPRATVNGLGQRQPILSNDTKLRQLQKILHSESNTSF